MTRLYTYIVGFILCVYTPLSAYAQAYNFRQLSNAEGLSQSQVLCVTQDKKGFLWIGTAGGGLNRFDGRQFKVFTTYDGMPDDNVWCIYSDSRDRLWLGTSTGIALFENGKFKTFPSYNGLDDDKIYDITEDYKGNIWIATENNGISVYDGKAFKNYGINDGLGFSECNRVLCEPDGTTWIGSYGYGLTRYKDGKFTRVGAKENFNAEYIFDAELQPGGGFLLLTEVGLYAYNQQGFARISHLDFDYTRSSDLMVDNKNQVWLATYGLGVYAIGEYKTTHFDKRNGLKIEDVRCLYQDNAGNIWMGTNGNGLLQYNGDAFINYNQSTGLSANIVRGMCFDKNQNLLLGTSIGIDKISPDGKVQSYFFNEHLYNCVNLYNDSQNRIWASFDNATGYFSENGRFNQVKSIPPSMVVNDIYEDHNKLMWLATNDGLFVMKGNSIARRLRDSIPETNIFSLKKSTYHDNAFWICSGAGLVLYDGKYIRSVRIKKPNENIDIIDVWEDPVGKLWVISNRGLCIVSKTGQKTWINKQNGLSSNNLFSIAYFGKSIWIGTDKGIDCIHLDSGYEMQRIEFFGKNKGFLGEEINSLGCLQHNGKLYFATINGLFIYNPGNYVTPKKAPDIYISEIGLNYRIINWEKDWPKARLVNGLPQNIEFKHDQNYFTFYFNAIDFNSPENVRIQFMLEGLDTSWIESTGERQATYSNLSTGKYVFKVRATNDNFYWGKTAAFKFTITAPFWQRQWFLLLMIPLVFLIGILVSQFRIKRLQRIQGRLKLKVDERTRELKYKNDELEQLSIVASQTNDGVLICDKWGKILFMNDGFKRMTGFSDPEAFNKSAYNKTRLHEISSQHNIDSIIRQIEKTGKAVTYESTHKLPDGNLMWTNASLTPIFNRDMLEKLIVIYTNITDRVITEQALIQTNKDITDSIHYAKKIQEAILPSQHILKNNFPDSFVFYRPRDIISGDFYWFTRLKNSFVIACADCTGHGVPGAMMTMIGNEFLHQIVNNSQVTGPDVALNLLDKQITRALNNENSYRESKDGMDIGLCTITLNNLFTQFSGANIPLYVVRDGELIEHTAVKSSIGTTKPAGTKYIANEFNLKKGDTLYLSTDGYIDQLGGERGRKFMRKQYKELLLSIQHLNMQEQYLEIIRVHEKHRTGLLQTDDILVIGIKV